MNTKAILGILVAVLIGIYLEKGHSQTSQPPSAQYFSLPNVFKLGEHDQLYESILPDYQTLLEACNGDMKVAHGKLYSMMKEMEAFAALMEFDLKGVKAWMHIFWREDGTIEYIGFHLKPNSRNIDNAELNAFLKNFTLQYKFPLTTNKKYSHYSSFSFPVF